MFYRKMKCNYRGVLLLPPYDQRLFADLVGWRVGWATADSLTHTPVSHQASLASGEVT